MRYVFTKIEVHVCVCVCVYMEGFLWPGSIRRRVSLITPTLTSLSTGLGTYLKTPGATLKTETLVTATLTIPLNPLNKRGRRAHLLLVLDSHTGVGIDLE